mmetsp:Transcript_17998/g.41629  ORF Transcript_17998/g.41629 Transcript_17998/m.41629 type:complete len:207 (-) Transcript_17998:89-709(-)
MTFRSKQLGLLILTYLSPKWRTRTKHAFFHEKSVVGGGRVTCWEIHRLDGCLLEKFRILSCEIIHLSQTNHRQEFSNTGHLRIFVDAYFGQKRESPIESHNHDVAGRELEFVEVWVASHHVDAREILRRLVGGKGGGVDSHIIVNGVETAMGRRQDNIIMDQSSTTEKESTRHLHIQGGEIWETSQICRSSSDDTTSFLIQNSVDE